jgi:pimeloyl-ACP methyl ester carboxylesterase
MTNKVKLPKFSIMSTNLLSTSVATGFGGVVQEYLWNWENQQLRVVYETLGKGSALLLLPSFSSVSTRSEIGELAKLLAPNFQVVALDWPGFGESSRLVCITDRKYISNFWKILSKLFLIIPSL